MITLAFAGFVLLSCAVALTDWRRGWLMMVLCGALQDPARKLTPGTPVAMTMTVILIYAVVVFAGQRELKRSWLEFTKRVSSVWIAIVIVIFFIVLAAINGLFTYGLQYWKVPALSMFIYLSPLPAVILGYAWLQDEKQMGRFFRFYAAITAVALIGTPLEYLGIKSQVIGLVALPEGYIRHLPGIQIQILSGFYRGPDIMGWHAATLACIGIALALRAGVMRSAWPWLVITAWGFFNCLISGRRKAVYMVIVFAMLLLWRYFRRLTMPQVISVVVAAVLLLGIVQYTASSERGASYAAGSKTTRSEIFERLEGGFVSTIRQFGWNGAGLGTATQGVRHLLGKEDNIGWQEGGLGKLAIELGVPGVLAVAFFVFILIRTLLRITEEGDLPGSPQLLRVTLFGLVAANAVNFMVSAQAYSDPVLTLMTAFFLGCLFGAAMLDERYAQRQAAAMPAAPALAPA